jgi:hypothetical protein
MHAMRGGMTTKESSDGLRTTALNQDHPNPSNGTGLRPVSRPVAHVLPTNPDFAEVVQRWDALPPETRDKIMTLVRGE